MLLKKQSTPFAFFKDSDKIQPKPGITSHVLSSQWLDLRGSGCSIRNKCRCATMVGAETKKSWRCNLLTPPTADVCLCPIRPRTAAYLGHRAADKGGLDPQHSSQPVSHRPLRRQLSAGCFDGGPPPFEVLLKELVKIVALSSNGFPSFSPLIRASCDYFAAFLLVPM